MLFFFTFLTVKDICSVVNVDSIAFELPNFYFCASSLYDILILYLFTQIILHLFKLLVSLLLFFVAQLFLLLFFFLL